MTSHLSKKIGKNSMQTSFGLYRRFLVDLAYLKKPEVNKFKVASFTRKKQKRSTEGCSKFKSPETRQVQERLVSTLEHMQVPKWDRTRCHLQPSVK